MHQTYFKFSVYKIVGGVPPLIGRVALHGMRAVLAAMHVETLKNILILVYRRLWKIVGGDHPR
jgi:hypothetical protein